MNYWQIKPLNLNHLQLEVLNKKSLVVETTTIVKLQKKCSHEIIKCENLQASISRKYSA